MSVASTSEESPDSAQRIDSFNGEQSVYFVPFRYLLFSVSLSLALALATVFFHCDWNIYSANLNRISVNKAFDSNGVFDLKLI